MIRRAAERDLGERLDAWTREAAALLTHPPPAPAVVACRAAQLAELRAALATYQRLTADQLSAPQARIATAATLLDTLVQQAATAPATAS